MSSIRPHNNNNAIKEVAFAIEFNQKINDQAIYELIDSYSNNKSIKNQLPGKKLVHDLNLNFDDSTSSKVLNGVSFSLIKPDGAVNWSLTVKGNSIIVVCGEYDCWTNVWSKAEEYINFVLLAYYNPEIKCTKIALEYFDEFIITDTSKDWTKELISKDSVVIPKHIFHMKDTLWHCNQGFFTVSDDTRILNNIDLSRVIHEGENLIRMRTSHQANVDYACEVDELLISIERQLKDSHNFNKSILSEILTVEMQQRINL